MSLTSTQWLEYHVSTKSALYNTLDPVNITTDAMSVDGYVLSLTACARDLTKNICELYGTTGYIRTAYTYSPYGQVTATGNVTQPIQWSSEYHDTELGLVYYNYRHYNPVDGRWLGRDRVPQRNLYGFVSNKVNIMTDVLGNNEYYHLEEYANKKVKCILFYFTDISKHDTFFEYSSDKIGEFALDKIEKQLKKLIRKRFGIKLKSPAGLDQMISALERIPYLYVSGLCACKCKEKHFMFMERYYDDGVGMIDRNYLSLRVNELRDTANTMLSGKRICE